MLLSLSNINICACGRPLFYISIVYSTALKISNLLDFLSLHFIDNIKHSNILIFFGSHLMLVFPNLFSCTMSCSSHFSLIMNTWSTLSGRSAGFCLLPISSSTYICPLRFGYPAQRRMAITSWKFCILFRILPVKVKGSSILFPTYSALV